MVGSPRLSRKMSIDRKGSMNAKVNADSAFGGCNGDGQHGRTSPADLHLGITIRNELIKVLCNGIITSHYGLESLQSQHYTHKSNMKACIVATCHMLLPHSSTCILLPNRPPPSRHLCLNASIHCHLSDLFSRWVADMRPILSKLSNLWSLGCEVCLELRRTSFSATTSAGI